MVNADPKPLIQANIIDNQIGLAIQTVKKKCQKYRKPPWLEKLHHESLKVRYWSVAHKEKLYDVLKKLPNRTYIRLIGAEPTMRDDLPEIIAKVKLTNER